MTNKTFEINGTDLCGVGETGMQTVKSANKLHTYYILAYRVLNSFTRTQATA